MQLLIMIKNNEKYLATATLAISIWQHILFRTAFENLYSPYNGRKKNRINRIT